MNKTDIYVIIPAFNEQPRLPQVLKSLTHYLPSDHIVVVDDGSSQPLQLKPGYWLLRHQINLGKGEAMKTGAEFAFSKKAKAIIFMDADGQHNPQELPKFIHYLLSGYQVVFGTRSFNSTSPLPRVLGNKFASFYIYLLFHIYVSDILSGFRGLTHNAYRKLKWDSPRYGVETEMIARLGRVKSQLTWIEFPIASIYKDKYKGVSLVQAIKILGETLVWKIHWGLG
jgi:glycosyltransferase involved in cell wall biosynthesis